MPLFYKASDVPLGTMDMGNTSFSTKMVFGTEASLMIAERPAGYHSRPHTHDSEQLNYLLSGELHIFFGNGEKFHLQEGDFLRIPANEVHWSWNKSDAPSVLIEVHTPGLQNDPMNTGFARDLLRDSEAASRSGPVNKFLPDGVVCVEEVEADQKQV